MDFQAEIAKLLAKHGVQAELELPPEPSLGDYALPCFSFAKERRQAPTKIAQELSNELSKALPAYITAIEAVGPYVNFRINPAAMAEQVIQSVRQGHMVAQKEQAKRVLIEYPSPNTNKPLHLGHVRNMVIGSTVASLLSAEGNEVIQVNLNNDRGVHICKSMLAYQRWGEGKQPDKKSDHFVGDFYVKFEQEKQKNPDLEIEAQAMLKAWEAGNPEVRSLWRQMNAWALNGFSETYKRYGVHFDHEYFESDVYEEGKKIVLSHPELFTADESGALIVKLEAYGLPDKVVLRADGTSIYITQDIALTLKKMHDYHPDKQLWVVANEQDLHFKQLFAILELLGTPRDSFQHLSYGLVALPDGRMKSREGRVIDADDILDELEAGASAIIKQNHAEWSEEQVQSTAKAVALCAMRFFMIKFDPARDFTFDPASSLSFEGDTGPYVQYTHARIASILAKTTLPSEADYALLSTEHEKELVRALAGLGPAVHHSVTTLRPNVLASQLLSICRAFNSFYHACPVLQAPTGVKEARLHLIDATRNALQQGLGLLLIDAPSAL